MGKKSRKIRGLEGAELERALADDLRLKTDAEQKAGGTGRLAKRFGVTSSAVSQWGVGYLIPRHVRPRLEDYVRGASEVREPSAHPYDVTRAQRRKAYFAKRHASVIDYICKRKVFQGDEETLRMVRTMLERMYPLQDVEWLDVKDIITGGHNG